MLLRSASAGFSKSGADVKVRTPVVGFILNLAASAPPGILYVRVFSSRSVEGTVVTAVVFSGIDMAAVSPPPLEVMTGEIPFLVGYSVSCGSY